jgi:hypothetical protein
MMHVGDSLWAAEVRGAYPFATVRSAGKTQKIDLRPFDQRPRGNGWFRFRTRNDAGPSDAGSWPLPPPPSKPHFLIRFRLLTPDEGGSSTPATTNYRPSLWLGQQRVDGTPMHWDVLLVFQHAPLPPGEETQAYMLLATLPPTTLNAGELLRFYEGPHQVGDGAVLQVHVPGHPQNSA